ncbi:MAG: flavin reductase family protein [Clostridia bacterium]|nr:flavin reductase family protein [Clostridia bacterium]
MARQNWKGSVLIAPVPPTMVTSAYEEKKNVFTVAWTGVLNTQPPKTYISVRPERYSYELIKNSGEFVINLTTTSMVKNADRCGTYSGRNVDKFKKYSIETIKAQHVSAPILSDSPVALECKVTDVVELGTHHMFIADIVGVSVDEKLLDEKGKLCLQKANLAAYAHGEYFALGKQIGTFGFSVMKKSTKQRLAENKSKSAEKNKKNR